MSELDEIFNLVKENRQTEAIEYVEAGKLSVIDCVDEHGTTPLQYAAFRGMLDLCKVLIAKGADVNAKTHDQGYSALMFAAISNHTSCVRLLLENDADVDYTNVIGRTSSQMASFVNSNECVDVIKAHLPRKSLEYYTEIHSINQKEPKLPKGDCCNELYKLLTSSVSYSPIRILKEIKMAKNNVLFDNMTRIISTLDAFVEKEFKGNECPNDVLSFKLHFYKYNFEFLKQQKKNLSEKISNEEELCSKTIENCIKFLLSEQDTELDYCTKVKYRVNEEKYLRESIRQFPYKECAILKQMVTVLAKTKIGTRPSALYVITGCLNGQRFNDDLSADTNLECTTCYTKSSQVKLCTHCRRAAYCDQYCQKLHWPIHKKEQLETK